MQKINITQYIKERKLLGLTLEKIPLSMKLSFIFMVSSVGLANAVGSYAQETRISLSAENKTVQEVLDQIEEKSEFSFFYNNRHVDLDRRVTVSVDNADIFKRDFIDIKNINYQKLENDILYSLSNETRANIRKLFGYEYSTPLKTIAKNIAPSYVQSILNVWNTPVKNRAQLLDGNKFMLYTALYWRIIASEFKDSSIVIVNMPLTANYLSMSAKSIADGGFVDRLVLENNNIKPSKSISIISTYTFLQSDADYETIKKMFSYYIVQSVGMMFPKYDVTEDIHSIMSEVNRFDYFNWYSNIVNFQLKMPYKTIKEYKDNIKNTLP